MKFHSEFSEFSDDLWYSLIMKKNKKMFVVIGVMNSGSGSLTWMEDFDLVGIYDNEEDAQSDCDARNPVNEDDMEDDRMEYDVYPLDVLKKK